MTERDRAVQIARRWLKADPIFLDTETTGLDKDAEICEIAILDAAGHILMDTLIRPLTSISMEASAVHGITDRMVANSPTLAEILPKLQRIVSGRTVLIYNLNYDWRLLWQSVEAHEIDELAIDNSTWHCAMKLYARFFGEWSDYWANYKWQKLGEAALHCGLELPKNLHRARADAELARQVMFYMGEWI